MKKNYYYAHLMLLFFLFAAVSCAPSPYRKLWSLNQRPEERTQSKELIYQTIKNNFKFMRFGSSDNEEIRMVGIIGNRCNVRIQNGTVIIKEFRHSGEIENDAFESFVDRLKISLEKNGASVEVKKTMLLSISGM